MKDHKSAKGKVREAITSRQLLTGRISMALIKPTIRLLLTDVGHGKTNFSFSK